MTRHGSRRWSMGTPYPARWEYRVRPPNGAGMPLVGSVMAHDADEAIGLVREILDATVNSYPCDVNVHRSSATTESN